jgi:hypothetical protein
MLLLFYMNFRRLSELLEYLNKKQKLERNKMAQWADFGPAANTAWPAQAGVACTTRPLSGHRAWCAGGGTTTTGEVGLAQRLGDPGFTARSPGREGSGVAPQGNGLTSGWQRAANTTAFCGGGGGGVLVRWGGDLRETSLQLRVEDTTTEVVRAGLLTAT